MATDNLIIYDQVRSCPKEAVRSITAGRLKGKSDINPMWRMKKLTELYGPAGVGWYYSITRQWLEQGANGEVAAFCNIDLYVRSGEEWSKPIQGTGGSSFIAKEKSGLYVSDECFKMALTDAISVACKALGFAADIYWESDKTKYSDAQRTGEEQYCCTDCGKPFEPFTAKSTGRYYNAGQAYHISEQKYGRALCKQCGEKFRQEQRSKEDMEEMI